MDERVRTRENDWKHFLLASSLYRGTKEREKIKQKKAWNLNGKNGILEKSHCALQRIVLP